FFVKLGHDVFIDVSMKVGTDWVDEITRRIEWCDFLIVLLSEAASEMVQAEVRQAYHRRRGRPTILPVRVNYTGALGYELDAFLGRIQFIDWMSDQDTPKVIAGIQDSITAGSQASVWSSPSLGQLDLSAPGVDLDWIRERTRLAGLARRWDERG